jgi:hypothetical protein
MYFYRLPSLQSRMQIMNHALYIVPIGLVTVDLGSVPAQAGSGERTNMRANIYHTAAYQRIG